MNLKRTFALGASIAAISAVAVVGAALAQANPSESADNGDKPAFFDGYTPGASTLSSFETDSKAPPTQEDLDQLKGEAPHLGETFVASSARTINFGSDQRITVGGTDDGALCLLAVETGVDFATLRSCGHDFPETGVIGGYNTTVDQPVRFRGVVAKDVTSLSILTSEGEMHPLDISHGAFYWVPEKGETIKNMTVVRAGNKLVDDSLFPGPVAG